MASKGFDQQQLDRVNGLLDTLVRVAEKEVPKLIKKTITEIQADVKALAPVSRKGLSRGNLKNNSIYKEVSQYGGKVYVDTTITDPRKNGFNYGRVVEHGRAGQYKTTRYFYEPVKKRIGLLYEQILDAIQSYKRK